MSLPAHVLPDSLDLDEATLTRVLLKLVKNERENATTDKPPDYPDHALAVTPWIQALETGVFSGRPFSHHTVANYARYVTYFLATYGNIRYQGLEQEFTTTPVDMFGRKDKFYRAIVCFAKFLDRHHSLPEADFLAKAKAIQPKRHKPPKRHTLTQDQLHVLYAAADSPQNVLLLKLLASTGIRASECCDLTLNDLDLDTGILTVACGKGGKRRRVGLSTEVIELLKVHVAKRAASSETTNNQRVFLDRFGQPLRRDGLLNRVRRIGQRAGVHASPHALRRAFVTINANKGRSLVMLQVACGHSDIKTTRSYCQTTEDEVIEAMKGW